MTLDSHCRYRSAFGDQSFKKQERTLVLRTAFDVVVVVVQRDLRIGFTRELECVKQIIRADGLKPRGSALAALAVETEQPEVEPTLPPTVG
jgi:hypothetical protein